MVACGDGGQAPLATPRLSYNGSMPFPAVAAEAIVLTPAVSGTLTQFRVNPDLPPGLSINEVIYVLSSKRPTARIPAFLEGSANGAQIRVKYLLLLKFTAPP